MKSNLSSFFALALMAVLPLSGISQSQDPHCNFLPHSVFKQETLKKPHHLNRLGTSPQFGEISEHSSQAAYSHLKAVYAANAKGSRFEINKLLKALGYSGINDIAFSEAQITPETLKAGTHGWMGEYSKGHKYSWSRLDADFESFRVMSKDNACFLFIMKKCGNAFYIPSGKASTGDYSYGNKTLAKNQIETKTQEIAKPTCVEQIVHVSGKGSIHGGDVINTSKMMEIVAVNAATPSSGKGLCLGTYNVPTRSSYEYTLNGSTEFSKAIQVCVQGNNAPAPSNVILPMNLNYKITKSDVSLGEGDKMVLTIPDAQFKSLSNVYKSCGVTTGNAAGSEAMARKVLSNNMTSNGGSQSTGGTQCADQKINFMGDTQVQEGNIKSGTQEVTLIGVYNKTGKLALGETAQKTLCLGTYQVPVKSNYEMVNSGGSNFSKAFKVCAADGTPLADQTISVPVDLKYNFTKQDVTVGDYNRIYVPIDESQYSKLSKNFNRCCTNGPCML